LSKFRKDINKSIIIDYKNNVNFLNYKKFKERKNKDYYYDVGQLYIYWSKYFLSNSVKIKTKIVPIILSDLEATDIDTKNDLIRAKKIYQLNKKS